MESKEGMKELLSPQEENLETHLSDEPEGQIPSTVHPTPTLGTDADLGLAFRKRGSAAQRLLNRGNLRRAILVTEILSPPLTFRPGS